MSDVPRYDLELATVFSSEATMCRDDKYGEWVAFDDYTACEAKLHRAADLLTECAADLAVYIETEWPEQTRAAHKGIQNKWDRDMDLVRRVEAMVAEIKEKRND